MITIVGTGDIKDSGGMSVAGKTAMDKADVLVFQSERQKCFVNGTLSLDSVYETSSDFDDFIKSAAEFVESLEGEVVLAVIGDGINNNVSRRLCKNRDVKIFMGSQPLCVAAAASSGIVSGGGLRYVNSYDFLDKPINTDEDTVIYQIDSEMLFWDIKSRLLDYYHDKTSVAVNENLVELADAAYNEPCDIFIPKVDMLDKKRYSYDDLMTIVKELRIKCPWDRAQDHKSIRSNLVEECFEFYDAIDNEDSEAMLEEMGDVLLQVCLHNVFELEHDEILDDEVTTLICQKLIRRHPHVYGDKIADNEVQVKKNWDEIKKQEYSLKSKSDELRHISKYLPALIRGSKVIKKSRKQGVEFEGDIYVEIKNLENNLEVQVSAQRFLLLSVKMLLDKGILPYIAMNDAVNSYIQYVGYMEEVGRLGDNGAKICVQDIDFDAKKQKCD